MLTLEKEKKYNIIERTYIDSKVSQVRWKPEEHSLVPNYFISGTCDEDVNNLELWHYPHSYWTRVVEDPDYQNYTEDIYPLSVQKQAVHGNVTDLKFIDHDKFLYSTDGGDFGLMNLKQEQKRNVFQMNLLNKWKNEYIPEGGNCSYVGFDSNEHFVCTVNSLGHLYLFSLDCAKSMGAVNFFDDGANCITILNENEILVGNLRGQLNLWDKRDMFQPSQIFPHNGQEAVGVTCASTYPLQRHILVSAGLDGAIITWDLRKAYVPLTVYQAHSQPITCLKFHNSWPTNMFTASMGGEVWHWTNFGDLLSNRSGLTSSRPFFANNKTKIVNQSTPEVQALIGQKRIPTNSLDVIKDQLVCSTDNDTFVFVRPLRLG